MAPSAECMLMHVSLNSNSRSCFTADINIVAYFSSQLLFDFHGSNKIYILQLMLECYCDFARQSASHYMPDGCMSVNKRCLNQLVVVIAILQRVMTLQYLAPATRCGQRRISLFALIATFSSVCYLLLCSYHIQQRPVLLQYHCSCCKTSDCR